MKIDSSGDEKVGQINGFKLLLSAWLQSTIRIVNYYPDIRIIRISISALLCMYVWMDGWMDGWMGVCTYICTATATQVTKFYQNLCFNF